MRHYRPFPWQKEVEEVIDSAEAQFINLNIGRGAGKTTLLTEIAWAAALEDVQDGLGPCHIPIFADTFEHGEKIFEQILDESVSVMAPVIHSKDLERKLIRLKSFDNPERPGNFIQLLSADNPNMMTGHNKTCRSISDESQFIKDESWRQFRPSLNIRKAKHIAAGVAQGDGWFKINSLRGFEPDDWPEYFSLRYNSLVNPYFTDADWELNKREYTPDEFEQLYEARWTSVGSVFENVQACIIAGPISIPLVNGRVTIFEEPRPGREYIAGVDIAKSRDFMAVLIADRWTGRVVAALRANKRTYTFLEGLVADLLVKYGARAWVDETGAGAAVVDHLRELIRSRYNDMEEVPERRVAIHPEQLQMDRKNEVIDDLALALLQERVRFPNIKQLVDELNKFEKKTLPSGKIRMSAPEGLHDDMVIALALLAQGLPSKGAQEKRGLASTHRRGGWEALE